MIEVHVAEIKQLFNAMDAAPFRDRDLDPNAEEFIVGWSRDLPSDVPITLVVNLGREPATPEGTALLQDAIHQYFTRRALASRRRLRELLRAGRVNLAISIVFLATAVVLGNFVRDLLGGTYHGEIVREALMIGSAVAMWRPLETFLYDWWPIRAEARLYDRLGTMVVQLVDAGAAAQTPGDRREIR